jgi:predicted RNA binding protein YcfA (HicA-like mRNA interferase family)
MEWRTAKAPRVLKALLRSGWSIERQKGSHRILAKPGWPDFTFAFHDTEEIGPRMLSRIAKHTGLTPDHI